MSGRRAAASPLVGAERLLVGKSYNVAPGFGAAASFGAEPKPGSASFAAV